MAKKSPAQTPDFGVSEVVALMTDGPARGRRYRSTLYLWLRKNHDQLAAEFAHVGPSWPRLAAILADLGLRNSEGKKASPEGVRTIWYRVRQDASDAKTRRAGGTSQTAGVISLEVEPAPAPARPVPIETDPDDTQAPRFKLASLRGATAADAPQPVKTPSASPVHQDDTPAQDVDEVLARLLGNAPPPGFQPKPPLKGNE